MQLLSAPPDPSLAAVGVMIAVPAAVFGLAFSSGSFALRVMTPGFVAHALAVLGVWLASRTGTPTLVVELAAVVGYAAVAYLPTWRGETAGVAGLVGIWMLALATADLAFVAVPNRYWPGVALDLLWIAVIARPVYSWARAVRPVAAVLDWADAVVDAR